MNSNSANGHRVQFSVSVRNSTDPPWKAGSWSISITRLYTAIFYILNRIMSRYTRKSVFQKKDCNNPSKRTQECNIGKKCRNKDMSAWVPEDCMGFHFVPEISAYEYYNLITEISPENCFTNFTFLPGPFSNANGRLDSALLFHQRFSGSLKKINPLSRYSRQLFFYANICSIIIEVEILVDPLPMFPHLCAASARTPCHHQHPACCAKQINARSELQV